MGKKNENTAQVLFEELLDGELGAAKASGNEVISADEIFGTATGFNEELTDVSVTSAKPKNILTVTESSEDSEFLSSQEPSTTSLPPLPAEKADARDVEKTQRVKAAEVFPELLSLVPQSAPKPSSLNLEDHLRSSNYLEIAQNRVLELEKEVQKLRRDNEQLGSAGKHFKELTEKMKAQVKRAEANQQNLKEISQEEKKILTQSLEAKEIKISVLQDRIQDIEESQGSKFEHIRIRERELENRLEIMKSENEALAQSKDDMILDLKKQLSSLNSDLEKYRVQNQKIVSKSEEKDETLRRTVKALRIALTMLEGSSSEED